MGRLPDLAMAIATFKNMRMKKADVPEEKQFVSPAMNENSVNAQIVTSLVPGNDLSKLALQNLLHPAALSREWPPDVKIANAENVNVVSSTDQLIKIVNHSTVSRTWDKTATNSPSLPTSSDITTNYSFNSKSKLKKYICSVCERAFQYKHVLENHKRTHTGEKPYGCPTCGKRFTRDHHLKTHMRLHTGEKPYKCEQCDKLFVQVANLRRHKQVHLKCSYTCTICSKQFFDSNELNAHFQTHVQIHSLSTVFPLHELVHEPESISVQTEPEDLSTNKKYRSMNNNNSSSSVEDLSGSSST